MTARKPLILAYDIGTTSVKTCLYEADEVFKLLASAMLPYTIEIKENGGAEQDPEVWLLSMAETTKSVLKESEADVKRIAGLTFSSQMQGLVLADSAGRAVRPAMSYMDQRAVKQKRNFGRGPKIEGIPLRKMLSSIRITGLAPTSVKDPIWKYLWVKENEPAAFQKTAYWLDVKDFIIFRLTGRPTATRDSACAAGLFDNRPGKYRWSRKLCSMYGADPRHLPEIIESHEIAGSLTQAAAEPLGLPPGIPVFGGGGDASLIGLGAGAVRENDAHIYMGTSGWVSVVTSKRLLDIKHMIASITCAVPDRYHYFCEQETSGKCLEWVRDHLALDEIGIYLEKKDVTLEPESIYRNLFEFLDEVIETVQPGCSGLLFTPWLHGSRSPFEDPNVRGMFFNIGLQTGKSEMIRSVVEGIAYNARWMLESIEKKITVGRRLLFAGGGALSPVTAQIMADITGREIEVPKEPHNTGALGAALIAAVGLQIIENLEHIPRRISVQGLFYPRTNHAEVYERNYQVFRKLYIRNKKLFSRLNKAE
jgi:xylulokinase